MKLPHGIEIARGEDMLKMDYKKKKNPVMGEMEKGITIDSNNQTTSQLIQHPH